MPIDLIDKSLSVPIHGKIRLGIKKTSKKTNNEYPENINYFNLDEVPEVAKVYGDKPSELDIKFYSEDIEDVAPYYYKCYSGGYKDQKTGKMTGGRLVCRGDGIIADHFIKRDPVTKIVPQRPCLTGGKVDPVTGEIGESCPDWCDAKGNQTCKAALNLYFTLPKINDYNVYQIDTTSERNIRNVISLLKLRLAANPGAFKHTVFRIYRYQAKTKYMYKGQEKSGNQFFLGISPYDSFWVENQKLIAERRSSQMQMISFSDPGMEVRVNKTPVELAENPMEDNYITTNTDDIVDPIDIRKKLANDPEFLPLFKELCELTNTANSEKTRMMVAARYEKDEDPAVSLRNNLNSQLEAKRKVQEPLAEQEPLLDQKPPALDNNGLI